MLAHVGGVPVEEFLPLLPAVAASAGLLLARARAVTARLARAPHRGARSPTDHPRRR